AWGAWFILGRVSVYAKTDMAQFAVSRSAHPIEALIEGRVVWTNLTLEQKVEKGEIVAEIDSKPLERQLQEERMRMAALTSQVAALQKELAAEKRALGQANSAALAEIDEAKARLREAETLSQLAEKEAGRSDSLFARNVVSEATKDKAQTEAARQRAAVESLQFYTKKMQFKLNLGRNDRQAGLKHVESEITEIEGFIAAAAGLVERLEYEIDQARIRAPITGRIGEVAEISIGKVVEKGERLATVIPSGTHRIVANFSPAEALGRIRPGQTAWFRLHGFPWAQHGSIAATVERAAREVRDGLVRIELSINEEQVSLIPVQHGLPGTIEVEVERISPALLALRAAGRLFSPQNESLPSPAQETGHAP
ncbi:MAG: HlyD family efflux transporter periplasmic adaptor subunit, partial [Desulfobulbaceae bacterium]|nr:HlyD family efflux transporter periplasmic adaptor subunit [Desulfobulbaceae bacterium]